MTEISSQATILQTPRGEVVLDQGRLYKSMLSLNLGRASVCFAERQQKDLETDERGIAYVDMNSSGRLALSKGQEGFIATSNLSGCTGVAGFAKGESGECLQFVSHYDSMSQIYYFTNQDSPINAQLWGFNHDSQAAKLNELAQIVIAYPSSEHFSPLLGNQQAAFNEWHYLDQLQGTASYLGQGTEVLFLPYSPNERGHTLAAGRENGHEGIFWDGIKIDFSAYLDRA